MEADLKQVDAVCEIVDARIPLASRNPDIDAICGAKPRMMILNRIDLADPAATAVWADWFRKQGMAAVPTDCKSRRGINRVHAISPGLPYRKAAYAASGLAQSTLTFEGVMARRTGNMTLAADSLVLYTNAGFKLSFGVAAGMMALALLELVYTLAVFFGHRFVEGWVTTMFVLTVGFAGVFGILAIVIKYLSLILEMVFRRQTYLVESVEKIQK